MSKLREHTGMGSTPGTPMAKFVLIHRLTNFRCYCINEPNC